MQRLWLSALSSDPGRRIPDIDLSAERWVGGPWEGTEVHKRLQHYVKLLQLDCPQLSKVVASVRQNVPINLRWQPLWAI